MNDDNKQEVTTETMRALRDEPDALRVITARLRVKDMSPADYPHQARGKSVAPALWFRLRRVGILEHATASSITR